MRAVGFHVGRPANHSEALVDLDLPQPVPGPRDVLVRVGAAGVNPIDCKLRMRVTPEAGQAKILGYDAAGTVVAVGSEASLFVPGDEVFYAGSMQRQGSNAEFQAVDERLIGRKPTSLDFAAAAALPLTSITAWEMLFEKFRITRSLDSKGVFLVIGGAGGVGSILIQLARQLTGLTIVATASRTESVQWCLDMGAHHVIDHHKSLQDQLAQLGLASVDYVASLTASDQHIDAVIAMTSVFGQICVIDDLTKINIAEMKRKSLTLHWEFMFARSNNRTVDMAEQGAILNEVARLVDEGTLRTTLHEEIKGLSAENLRAAHVRQESNGSIGKLVIGY